jgi:outer membrane protein assembly factor BamB
MFRSALSSFSLILVSWSGIHSTAWGQDKVPTAGPFREIRALDGGEVVYAISHDSKLVAILSSRGAGVWNVRDGTLVTRVQLPKKQQHPGKVAFVGDGKTLIVMPYNDPMMRIFDLKTGKQIEEFPHERSSQHVIRFSPDLSRIAMRTADWSTGTEIFDLKERKFVQRLNVPGQCFSASFSQDGKLLTTSIYDGRVQVWDAANGRMLTDIRLKNIQARGCVVGLSPDGKFVVGSSNDTSLTVWNAQTGQQLHTFATHKPRFNSERPAAAACFSPDGQSVLYMPFYADGPVLRNLITDRDVLRFRCRPQEPEQLDNIADSTAASFSPNFKQVAVLAASSVGGSLDYQNGQRSLYLFNVPANAFEPAAARFDDAPLDKLWLEMSTDNDLRLQIVIKAFRAAPKQTVELIVKKVRPIPVEDQREAEKLVAEFAKDSLSERYMALKEKGLLHQFTPLLKKGVTQLPAGQARDFFTQAVNQLHTGKQPADLTAQLRAVTLLEQLGTKAAIDHLERLAEGAEGARLTIEARAAVARLKAKTTPR